MKPSITSTLRALAVSCGLLALTHTATAQDQVFFEDWETDHSLDATYRTNYTAGGINFADLYFDYSTAGIPLSPHSSGVTTRALKMAANLDSSVQVFPSGVSVSPVGFGITTNFEMRFDMWGNFNGPLPGGGSGSTQVGGAGYGTAGTNAQVAGTADSVFIGATADGGSSADYRVYSPGHQISYQDGAFRIGSSGTDPNIKGDPASGYVYAGTNRNSNTSPFYYTTHFPPQTVPLAQLALYPQQTNSPGAAGVPGSCAAGAQAFKWREVALRKVANIITYTIDGILIATVDVNDAGTLGGTNILFNHYDINAGASIDPNRTNLNFTLIDNVRITNFANVVSVVATSTPSVTEGVATPGVFTITRTAAGAPLTVAYTMSGLAQNGVDYTNALGGALSGTITFDAAAITTNITIFPVNDALSEVTESIILSIDESSQYIGAGTATITIIDDDPSLVTITNVSKQMYERTNDYATFRVSRLGNTNTTAFSVNLSFSGTATLNTDYYTNLVVTIPPGIQTSNINVYPIQDGSYEGNETVTIGIAPAGGGEYAVGPGGPASITLVDADGPGETVLFSDDFNNDSSFDWTVLFGATNALDPDYTAIFAFDYSGQNIPPAPHGSGDTLGLFVTVNKNITLTGIATAAALNLYPNGQNFSGNFALKFDMFLNMIPSLTSTEYSLFGINHSGTKTNWWRSGGVPAGWMFDGIFYAVETDAQSSPHYVNYSSPAVSSNNPAPLTSGTNVNGFVDAFKSPPWIVAGSPAMSAPSNTPVWADVELSQIGNVLTLSINHTKIFSYTNTTGFTNGNVMLGYLDAFDSLGNIQNYVIYDNLRVVRLDGLDITTSSIQDLGASVRFDFTLDTFDSPDGFKVQCSPEVAGPYADVAATIVQTTPGTYRATVAKSGPAQFYRVRRL